MHICCIDWLTMAHHADLSVVKPNHDLQAQLTHRKERLSFLIKFINDNGVLTKVTQPVSQ